MMVGGPWATAIGVGSLTRPDFTWTRKILSTSCHVASPSVSTDIWQQPPNPGMLQINGSETAHTVHFLFRRHLEPPCIRLQGGIVVLVQQRPDDARILVGNGSDGVVHPAALPEFVHPWTETVCLAGSGSRRGSLTIWFDPAVVYFNSIKTGQQAQATA